MELPADKRDRKLHANHLVWAAPPKNVGRPSGWRVTAVLGPLIDWPIAFRNTVQNGSLRKPAAAGAILAARGRHNLWEIDPPFWTKITVDEFCCDS